MDGYCASVFYKTTIHSDKNLRGSNSILKVVHRLQKINVQVFWWLNSAKFLNSIALQGFQKGFSESLPSNHQGQASVTFSLAQNIFLAKRSGSRNDYRTVHGSPILQVILKWFLLCFSLWQIFTISSTTSDLLFFWTFFYLTTQIQTNNILIGRHIVTVFTTAQKTTSNFNTETTFEESISLGEVI